MSNILLLPWVGCGITLTLMVLRLALLGLINQTNNIPVTQCPVQEAHVDVEKILKPDMKYWPESFLSWYQKLQIGSGPKIA